MKKPVLDISSFRYFFLSRIAMTLSNQMLMVIVAWQMYDITHSAFDLGMVGLAQFVPALALCLVVGQVADRYDRRRVLIGCLIGQFAVALLLIAGTLGGWLGREVILIASFGLGTAKAFQLPTQQALLPTLVPLPVLPRALAINSAGSQFATIIGPAIGGFIYVAGAAVVYSACVVVRQSLVQLETPNEMRGRFSAVNSIFIGASNQLGEFESGVTAGWLGAVPSVLLGGASTMLIVALWMKLFPSLAQRAKLTVT
jgi:MFS family permease